MSSLEKRIASRTKQTRTNRAERRRLALERERIAYGAFLRARNSYLLAYHQGNVIVVRRFVKDPLGRTQAYQDALRAYLHVYGERHSRAGVERQRRLLESQTILMSRRTTAAQFFAGKAVKGAFIDLPKLLLVNPLAYAIAKTEAGRKLLEKIKRDRGAQLLTIGALVAALIAAGAAYIPTAVAITAGIAVTKVSGVLVVRNAVPKVLSFFPSISSDKLSKARAFLGWGTWAAGGLFSYEAVHYGISEAAMANMHMASPDEHLDKTAKHVMEHLIEWKRGAPTFLPIDHQSDSVLSGAIASVGSEARENSPALSGMFDRLQAFNTHRSFLLNNEANRRLIAEGITKMRHLRVLEEAKLHGDDGFANHAVDDLPAARRFAFDWNERFDAETAAALDEKGKNAIQLSGEFLNVGREMPPPPLALSLAHPAHLSELPITSLVTPENYTETLVALHERLGDIDVALRGYHRVIGDGDALPGDHTYSSLVAAHTYYQGLARELENFQDQFDRMPGGHRVIEHYGSLYTTNLRDALLLDRIRRIDFSHYEGAWADVEAAHERVASVHTGEIYINGRVVPIKDAVLFKEDAGTELPPALGRSIYQFSEALKHKGIADMHVTEGYPLTRRHRNPGQEVNHSSLDIGLIDRNYSVENLDRMFNAEKSVTNAHAAVVLETSEHGLYQKLVSGLKARGYADEFIARRVRYYPSTWISATHLSFYTDEPSLAALPHFDTIAANDNVDELSLAA